MHVLTPSRLAWVKAWSNISPTLLKTLQDSSPFRGVGVMPSIAGEPNVSFSNSSEAPAVKSPVFIGAKPQPERAVLSQADG